MTSATFKYISPTATARGRPWSKVDGGGTSFDLDPHKMEVESLRGREHEFGTDVSGFAVYREPAKEKLFADDAKVRKEYYAEVETLIKNKLPGVKKVVIFDHTIRRRDPSAPRQPVQQVHVDQTQKAAETRVRRHLPQGEAEDLIRGRYQIVNVWRPIGHPASDFPLAVIDWRSTQPEDFIETDLLYPKREETDVDADDRGKEKPPVLGNSAEGYEPRGETYNVKYNDRHKFWYMKDMTPEEVMFLKCFDSRGDGVSGGKQGLARCTPHTAFVDPLTPKDAPGRQSIEVRCLVFYE